MKGVKTEGGCLVSVTSNCFKNIGCQKRWGWAHLGAHHDVHIEVVLDIGLDVRHTGVLWRK